MAPLIVNFSDLRIETLSLIFLSFEFHANSHLSRFFQRDQEDKMSLLKIINNIIRNNDDK